MILSLILRLTLAKKELNLRPIPQEVKTSRLMTAVEDSWPYWLVETLCLDQG